MSRRQFTRRRFLATTAAASAVAIGAPYVRSSRAAGRLSVGCWDHWVPGANDTLTAICQEWAKTETCELKIASIPSKGNKIMMPATAESQAQSGHDVLQFLAWYPLSLAKSLEPLDDVMGGLLKQNGKVSPAIEYLGRSEGHWLGVPAVTGPQGKPPPARPGLLKAQNGLRGQGVYPARQPPPQEAEHCDRSIFNPPSAWAVAKRDNLKVAEQLWTFEMPKGPQGRYAPFLPFLWGVWKFSKNKPAAKSLLAHLLQRQNVERIVNASGGYDIPSFESMRDFKVWEQVEPPKGTVYHYPPRTQVTWMAGAPAPASIAQQMDVQAINTKMIARCTQGGDSIDKTIGWAASELEGYMRS